MLNFHKEVCTFPKSLDVIWDQIYISVSSSLPWFQSTCSRGRHFIIDCYSVLQAVLSTVMKTHVFPFLHKLMLSFVYAVWGSTGDPSVIWQNGQCPYIELLSASVLQHECSRIIGSVMSSNVIKISQSTRRNNELICLSSRSPCASRLTCPETSVTLNWFLVRLEAAEQEVH